MHPLLFDLHEPGKDLRKFWEEFSRLSLARHPNIVQYLGAFSDHDTQLPIILMEFCDENLTSFLERSPAPPSYHIQINICYDIALALVYLHSNGLIHRDLTGNNVLMIAGTRTKVTDIGMSHLASIDPNMMALNIFPRNGLYMPFEALDEIVSYIYTDKHDIFSFGIIVIQLLTRCLPILSDSLSFEEKIKLVVTERAHHLKQIPSTHCLKQIVEKCLTKEFERPSALQLSQKLSELKYSPEYENNMHQVRNSSEIEQIKQQLHQQRILTNHKAEELDEYQGKIVDLRRRIGEKIKQLEASEQLVSNLEQSVQQKDQTIIDLQQKVLTLEEEIQQLKQQATVNDDAQFYHPELAAAIKDINNMTWKKGKNAPQLMHRGAAVVHRNIAYVRPAGSQKVYSYRSVVDDEQWSELPQNLNKNFGLAVIDGLLTSVGGWNMYYTNSLLSLMEEGKGKRWSEIFPSMPTPREDAACITTHQALVVAGGRGTCSGLDIVEVMDMSSKCWGKVSCLPQKYSSLSTAFCEGTLYLAGGITDDLTESTAVFSCSLSDLLSRSIKSVCWRNISGLPVTRSSLVTIGGCLLAFGGKDDSDKPVSDIYKYDTLTDTWTATGQMKNKRSDCFLITLSNDILVIVGGYAKRLFSVNLTDAVDILE